MSGSGLDVIIIASKRAAARPKDLSILIELEALRELKAAEKKTRSSAIPGSQEH